MSVQENLQLMKTLDDAWNAQDWETFDRRHAENTAVYWPGQPEPTRGRHNHRAEAIEFFKIFDNSLENDPYMVMFGQGDWTCTIAKWKGTMKGPMTGLMARQSGLPTRALNLSSARSPAGRMARSWRRSCFTTRWVY
jgi:hypothetical protein